MPYDNHFNLEKVVSAFHIPHSDVKGDYAKPQKAAYEILQARIDLGGFSGTICIVGNFLSGKTVLVKQFLSDRFEHPEDYYLNVNLYLLEQLKKEEDLSNLILTKAKTRLIMQVTLEEAIRKHFKTYHLLVLDAIEIIYPYNLNLITITNKYARNSKICIICVPENRERGFVCDFSWGLCEVISLESKRAIDSFASSPSCPLT